MVSYMKSRHGLILITDTKTEGNCEMVTESRDVQQLLVKEEYISTDQQECSSSLSHEGQESFFLKREREVSNNLSLSPVHEKDDEDEEEPLSSTSIQHMKTEADGDQDGGSEPVNDLDTFIPSVHQRITESDTDDSEDWGEPSSTQLELCSHTPENPKVHIIENTDSSDQISLICSDCGRTCSSDIHLKTHMKSHSGEKPYICTLCDEEFTSIGILKTHVRIHTREKPFICFECGKSFNEIVVLKRHMRIHTGEKPFICSQCGKRFNYSHHLTTHMRTHTGEKPFVCQQCGKGFNYSHHMKAHMRTHSGEKPFVCSQCSKGFTEMRSLKTHLRTHTGEKPFICSLCGKDFTQTGSLNDHMRLHTGEKPYTCSKCGECFKHRVSLTRHMRMTPCKTPHPNPSIQESGDTDTQTKY